MALPGETLGKNLVRESLKGLDEELALFICEALAPHSAAFFDTLMDGVAGGHQESNYKDVFGSILSLVPGAQSMSTPDLLSEAAKLLGPLIDCSQYSSSEPDKKPSGTSEKTAEYDIEALLDLLKSREGDEPVDANKAQETAESILRVFEGDSAANPEMAEKAATIIETSAAAIGAIVANVDLFRRKRKNVTRLARVRRVIYELTGLADALDTFYGNPGEHDFEDYLREQLAKYVVRAVYAQAIETLGSLRGLNLKSNKNIGSVVHKSIQKDYRKSFSLRNDVAIEKWDVDRQFEEQVVVGPSTGGTTVFLRDIAENEKKEGQYGFWSVLRTASNGRKLNKDYSWLRADLVDRNRESIWEIKPVAQALTGVWQEATLKIPHNMYRKILTGRDPHDPGRINALKSGKANVFADRTDARPDGYLGEGGGFDFDVLGLIDVTKQSYGKGVAVAAPFTVSVLPGMILYPVFRTNIEKEILASLLFFLTKAINDAVKKLESDLGDLVDDIEEYLKDMADSAQEYAFQITAFLAYIVAIILMLRFGPFRGMPLEPALPAGGGGFRPMPGQFDDGGLAKMKPPSSLRDHSIIKIDNESGRLRLTLAPSKGKTTDDNKVTYYSNSIIVQGIPEDPDALAFVIETHLRAIDAGVRFVANYRPQKKIA